MCFRKPPDPRHRFGRNGKKDYIRRTNRRNMKRSFFALALATLTIISCSPLKIVMNTTSPDGKRTVATSNQPLFNSNGGQVSIALGTRISGKDTIVGIVITYDANTGRGVFDKDHRMMFRLTDKSEITLKNLYDREFENIDETTVTDQFKTDYGVAYSYDPWLESVVISPYEVTRLVPQVHHYKTTNSYALYLITRQQLDDIITKGVIKLRIESADCDLDMTNTEGVSALFTSLRNCLTEGVKAGPQRSAF